MHTLVCLLVVFWTDDKAYDLLQLWNEPNEDEGVGQVEDGVESCQDEAEFGGIIHECPYASRLSRHVHIEAHQLADEIDEWMEDTQDPHHAKEVEEHMRKGGTACLGGGGECGKGGGDGSADVFTHHKGYALIDGECAARTENHGDCHHGC